MTERPILVAGSSGILGTAFSDILARDVRIDLPSAIARSADADAIRHWIAERRPSVVINCIADTDVEGAEAAPARAQATNALLAGDLARTAVAVGAQFVHFSSTGCYGAWKGEPYDEDDPLRPTTEHHRSKAMGEDLVLEACPQALILRLGWLFGGRIHHRKNFVWARLQEAQGTQHIGSNPVQIGSPTFSDDVARQTLKLLEAGANGVFNCTNAGTPVSRLRYVAEILAAANSPTTVVPVSFSRRAPVSPNEAAINRRLGQLGLEIMPEWRVSLAAYVRTLAAAEDREDPSA